MIYFIFQRFFSFWFNLFYLKKVEGHEHIPETGPVVIVCNHISNWDPLSLGSSVKRQVFYMAKDSLFRIPGVGFLLRKWGAFPVKRGAADRSAIRHAIQLLEEQKVIGIFPEGRRSRTGQLGKAFPGAVSIALKGNAVVVPAAIVGPYRLFRQLTVRFGSPIDLDAYKQGKVTSAVLEEAAEAIMSRIAELL